MRIAASLTAADPLRLGDAAARLAAAGVDALHVDFGDGRFVPWLGGGVEMVAALSESRVLPVEVHLMLEEPEHYVPLVAAAGAAAVVVHVEAVRYPWRLRETARRLGLRFGLAINPATPIAVLDSLRDCAGHFSLLTTEPDGAGERMLPSTLPRLRAAAALLGEDAEIEVDGGVDPTSSVELCAAGATRLVVGRALTAAADPSAVVARLLSRAATVAAP